MASFRLLFFCFSTILIAQQPQGDGDADIVEIVSVSPGAAKPMHHGERLEFKVEVRYSLQSRDKAILQVYAERYASGPRQCDQAALHQTEGGTTVVLRRGSGSVRVKFRWREGSGPDAKVPPGGSLAIGMNLWQEENGKPVKPMFRAFGTSFCRPVSQ